MPKHTECNEIFHILDKAILVNMQEKSLILDTETMMLKEIVDLKFEGTIYDSEAESTKIIFDITPKKKFHTNVAQAYTK